MSATQFGFRELLQRRLEGCPVIAQHLLLPTVNKPKLREKYGIMDEWVMPYKVITKLQARGGHD